MWRVVEHSCKSGEWVEHGVFSDIDSGKTHVETLTKTNHPDVFYFWANPLPKDKIEQQKIFDAAFEVNGDRLRRIVLDAELSKKADSLALCSGNCFCVVAHGRRDCETQYCNDKVCWWVSCGSSC